MPVKTISLIAFSTLAFATAASADEVKFGYSASELQSTAGAEQVFARMEREATSACEAAVSNRSLQAQKVAKDCADNLINEWVGEVGDARLHQIQAATQTQKIASAE
ncbi:MAG: UrcA family protein [Parvularculaceae bacterium]